MYMYIYGGQRITSRNWFSLLYHVDSRDETQVILVTRAFTH